MKRREPAEKQNIQGRQNQQSAAHPPIIEQRRMLNNGCNVDGRFVICEILSYNEVYVVYTAKQLPNSDDICVIEYFPEHISLRSDDSCEIKPTQNSEIDFAEGASCFEAEMNALFQNVSGSDSLLKVSKPFRVNGTVYVFADKHEGMTLSENIAVYGAVSEERLVEQLLPILLALKLYHDAGFTHSAISPDNFRCLIDGRLILEGFGMSGALKLPESNLRSNPYAAPELANGTMPSVVTDIYSIGAVMYTALTGTPPDRSRNENGGIVYPSSLGIKVSNQTEAAILSALNLSPNDRPQNLDRFIDILVGNVTDVRLPPMAAVKKRKLSLAIGIIIAAVILVLACTAGYLAYRSAALKNNIQDSLDTDESQTDVEQPLKAKDYIETEDYIGMDAQELNSLLAQHDVGLIKSASIYTDAYSFNTVVMQYPEAGGKVYKGGSVYIVTSMGSEQARVPDVRGMQCNAAISALEAKGLSWQLEYIISDGDMDCVLEQSTQAGRKVPFGTAIKLIIASDEVKTVNPIGGAIEILPKSVSVNIAEKVSFECKDPVSWGISDTTIADIDENGNVTAKGFGTTTVFAASEGRIATAVLTVHDMSIFAQNSISITIGQTVPISDDIAESIIDEVVWSTSDETVATIDDNGNITAVGIGNATITAQRADEIIKSISVIVSENAEYIKLIKASLYGNVEAVKQTLIDNGIEFSFVEEYSNIHPAGSVTNIEYNGYIDNDSFYINKGTKIVLHISLGKKP